MPPKFGGFFDALVEHLSKNRYTYSVRKRTLSRFERSLALADIVKLKEITRLTRKLRRFERAMLRDHARQHGLTPNELLVMDTLTDYPIISLSHLAGILQLNKSTVSTVVDSLIERRLINKQTDPDNLSRYQLMLTATGEQLTTGIYETYLAALSVRLQLTPQTIDEALLLLRTVSQQGKLEAQS